MRKIMVMLFLCGIISILGNKSSYAEIINNQVTINDSDVHIVVTPLTTARWNYRGVVPYLEHPDGPTGLIGVTYSTFASINRQ